MSRSSLFTITASAAFMAALGSAPAQSQLQNGQPQQERGSFLDRLFGNVFGNNDQPVEQTLDTGWNQGQRPFDQRRERFETRLDSAVRDGSLSRSDADYMQREYEDIVRLEAQYSANGPMQPQQRSELRSRYRALMQRVGYQNNMQTGGQDGPSVGGWPDETRWQPIAQQNNLFEQRLGEAVRNRQMTQTDATRLRTQWRNLAQIESQYQRGGIDAREQADLWMRYRVIDNRLGGISRDGTGSGFGDDRNPQRWRLMEQRVVAAQRAGRLNATQAAQVRAQLGDLERLDAAYGRTGYSNEQRSYLARRYNDLDTAMGTARR